MKNNSAVQIKEQKNMNSKRRQILLLVLKIVFTALFVVLAAVCIVFANLPPFSKSGGEAGKAILFFVAFISLAFSILGLFLILFKNKQEVTLITKEEKKYNIMMDSIDGEINEEELVVTKVKHDVSSLKELDEYLKQYIGVCGYKVDNLSSLLGAFIYSRLMIVKTNDEGFIDAYTSFFGQDITKIDYIDNGGDITSYIEFEIVRQKALANHDLPFFVVINKVQLSKMREFFSPIYQGIASPTEKCCYISRGEELLVPKNIIFILKVDANENLFDAGSDLLDYASYIEPAIKAAEKGETLLPVNLSYSILLSLLKDSKQNYSISEDAWKRVDAVMNNACENTNFVIDNKAYLKIENFCHALFVFLDDEFKAIDEMFSDVVLTSIMSHWDEEATKVHIAFEKVLTTNFGKKTPKAINRVRQFFELSNREDDK